jgi:hypothetical protein
MHADITVGGLVTANAEGELSASTRPAEFRSPAKPLPRFAEGGEPTQAVDAAVLSARTPGGTRSPRALPADVAANSWTARLDRALIWNQAHLRRILREYENHTITTGCTAP